MHDIINYRLFTLGSDTPVLLIDLVNITQMILHISVGHVFMPFVCGLYLLNGVASLIGWLRLYRRNA